MYYEARFGTSGFESFLFPLCPASFSGTQHNTANNARLTVRRRIFTNLARTNEAIDIVPRVEFDDPFRRGGIIRRASGKQSGISIYGANRRETNATACTRLDCRKRTVGELGGGLLSSNERNGGRLSIRSIYLK